MKKIKMLPVVLIVVTALVIASVAYASPAFSQNFAAPLSGGEEVPVRDTNARGVATFKLSEDGTALSYKVNVANIENVFAAHIHCGAVGVSGPVGVTLFMGTPGGGRVDGTLAEGVITAPDAGNACGWADLAAVLSALNSGNAYVNVHTNDGVAPANTGPGDFPGGEIRGQIK
jgi:CHRD domain-containing protein